MSRRRRRQRSDSDRPSAVSQRPLATLLRPSPAPPAPLRLIEDRRTYHPLGPDRPARQVSGHPSKPLQVKPSKKFRLPPQLGFSDPTRVVVCVRRKTRKEVLFALKKMGAGKRRRRPRRNWLSNIEC